MSLQDLIDQAMKRLGELDQLPPPVSGIAITRRAAERAAIEETLQAMLRAETEMAMLRPPPALFLDEEIPITRIPDPYQFPPVVLEFLHENLVIPSAQEIVDRLTAMGAAASPKIGHTIHVRKPLRFRGSGAEIEPLEWFRCKLHLVPDQDTYPIGPGADIATGLLLWPERLLEATTVTGAAGHKIATPLEITETCFTVPYGGLPQQIYFAAHIPDPYVQLWPGPRAGERLREMRCAGGHGFEP